jgi:hypothetical protein
VQALPQPPGQRLVLERTQDVDDDPGLLDGQHALAHHGQGAELLQHLRIGQQTAGPVLRAGQQQRRLGGGVQAHPSFVVDPVQRQQITQLLRVLHRPAPLPTLQPIGEPTYLTHVQHRRSE